MKEKAPREISSLFDGLKSPKGQTAIQKNKENRTLYEFR